MIETICDPYGKAAFPTVVKCDGCGEKIYDGYREYIEHRDANGKVHSFSLGDKFYCDDCAETLPSKCEFRTCDYCGKPITEGFMVEGGGWYCCNDCFEPMMKRDYPNGYRANTHDDDPWWCDGMWDYMDDDGEWRDTGIFYTEWY